MRMTMVSSTQNNKLMGWPEERIQHPLEGSAPDAGLKRLNLALKSGDLRVLVNASQSVMWYKVYERPKRTVGTKYPCDK